MRKTWKVLLTIVAVACFAVALSYPIRYRVEAQRVESAMERLIAMRDEDMEDRWNRTETTEAPLEGADANPAEEPAIQPASDGERTEDVQARERTTDSTAAPTERPAGAEIAAGAAEPDDAQPRASAAGETEAEAESMVPRASAAPTATLAPTPTPEPTPTPVPTVDPSRYARTDPLPYSMWERRALDVEEILPEYRRIYEQNQDMVGWITIPDTVIDYPVVQTEDGDYYLSHDFFGDANNNGQLILDAMCDPYTPSYNLIVSGHNMRSDLMFGMLDEYRNRSFWNSHKILYFDSLMERREYVVFAAFYSADYDVDEKGFRYSADIQYRRDAEDWLEEIRKNQLYDTEIDVKFGDEFLTLTTCNKARRKDGRFVVVCRRIRKGEEFK